MHPNIILVLTDIVAPEKMHSYHSVGEKVNFWNVGDKSLLFTRHPFVFLWLVSAWSTVEVHLNFSPSVEYIWQELKLIQDLAGKLCEVKKMDLGIPFFGWYIYLPNIVTSECTIIAELHPFHSSMAEIGEQMKEWLRWEISKWLRTPEIWPVLNLVVFWAFTL